LPHGFGGFGSDAVDFFAGRGLFFADDNLPIL
jgi:hypothetical protein